MFLVSLHFFNQSRRWANVKSRSRHSNADRAMIWSALLWTAGWWHQLAWNWDALLVQVWVALALGSPGSGMYSTWLSPCGLPWTAGQIWRVFLKNLALHSVCTSPDDPPGQRSIAYCSGIKQNGGQDFEDSKGETSSIQNTERFKFCRSSLWRKKQNKKNFEQISWSFLGRANYSSPKGQEICCLM